MILLIYGIEETKQMSKEEKERNKPINRLITIENKLTMVNRGEVGGRDGGNR